MEEVNVSRMSTIRCCSEMVGMGIETELSVSAGNEYGIASVFLIA